MSKKKVIINKAETSKHIDKKGSIYVSLPVPERSVIENIDDHGSQIQYMNIVRQIAQLESETIIKTASIRFSGLWKIFLIICVFLSIVLALIISDKVQIKWNGSEINTSKPSNK